MTPSSPITPHEIDENIETDIDFWTEQKHANDEAQDEWVEEGWTN